MWLTGDVGFLPEQAGDRAGAGGGKHERDGEDAGDESDETAEDIDGGEEAQGGWLYDDIERHMSRHLAHEALMPGAAAVHGFCSSSFTMSFMGLASSSMA
jgi:hypothetical protein